MPVGGVGAQRVAELAHRGGGLRTVSGHVADDHRRGVRAEVDDVVPVAADLGALGPRQVSHGVPRAGQRRQGGRQQRTLQVLGDGQLCQEQQRPLERLRAQPAEGHQGGPFVVVELPRLGVADHQDAEHLPGGDQWKERPCLTAATADRGLWVGLSGGELRRRGHDSGPGR